jgi:four helix bundle protein
MGKTNFEMLRVYQLAERLADDLWDIALSWDEFAKDTVGKQIVRAADSIGANIAEGTGRGSYKDNRRFVRIARASLYETKHWLKRAYARKLLTKEQAAMLEPIYNELAPRLNSYLKSIGTKKKKAGEQQTTDKESKPNGKTKNK